MVGRSRRNQKEDEMDEKATRMLFATLALSALAVLLAGPANAYIGKGDGVSPVSTQSQLHQQTQVPGPGAIPYLSQGIGVDASQFAGAPVGQRLPGPHGALQLRQAQTPVAPLPHGIQVVLSPSSEAQPLGLTGDSPLTRVSAPEPEGLTGDSAATRYPVTASQPTGTTSSGDDFDWTVFGAGAAMVALVAAALGGVLLTARRRHSVGLP
jgi:hypothetical protein